jgi:hypothetical protein
MSWSSQKFVNNLSRPRNMGTRADAALRERIFRTRLTSCTLHRTLHCIDNTYTMTFCRPLLPRISRVTLSKVTLIAVPLFALLACGSPQYQNRAIVVTWSTGFPPPASLGTSQTEGIAAVVTNDPKNAGVNFTSFDFQSLPHQNRSSSLKGLSHQWGRHGFDGDACGQEACRGAHTRDRVQNDNCQSTNGIRSLTSLGSRSPQLCPWAASERHTADCSSRLRLGQEAKISG